MLPAWLPRSAWSCVAQRFAFGLELGYALIQWPIGDVIARESEFSAPKAVGQRFRDTFSLGDGQVQPRGFALKFPGDGFDRLGMARVRQNLHSDGSGRVIQATLINADLGTALAARRRAAPVFPAYRTVLVPLQSVYWVTCERFAAVRTAAEGYPRAQVGLRGRLAAPARGVYRAYPVEVVFGNDRLSRQMPGNGLNVCFRIGVEDSPAVALSEQKKLQGSDSPRPALAAEDAACVEVTYQRVLRFSRQEPPSQLPDDLGFGFAHGHEIVLEAEWPGCGVRLPRHCLEPLAAPCPS